MKYIKFFDELRADDTPLVGGKNASLGQMIAHLADKGVTIPNGFALTAGAYWYYLEKNELLEPVKALITKLDVNDIKQLQKTGAAVRKLIANGTLPDDLKNEIDRAYKKLCGEYVDCDVAVRSSATAEDLPEASFAGQQETFLNVRGRQALHTACKKSMASLFTDRAIVYRVTKGFDHFDVALSVGVQKMIRSDKASSGVAFSLDTESGFADVVMINASWGLGESIVKGIVIPDEYLVFKPTLEKGYMPIIKKELGEKTKKIIYAESQTEPTEEIVTTHKEQQTFCLTDDEILSLSRMIVTIEKHYSELNNRWMPMDIEWAKDGIDGELYILQARPETVHAIQKQKHELVRYEIDPSFDGKKYKNATLTTGYSIGQQIASGVARVIQDASAIDQVKEGDVIVTDMTDPDWVPAMKRAAGIITNRGGRTCHAAIVSRELGIPCIVGTTDATDVVKSGTVVSLDCSQGTTGVVLQGEVSFEKVTIPLNTIPKIPVEIMVNIADPDIAFTVSALPVDGVGLARIEFIISNEIKVHPMALVDFSKVEDKKVRDQIEHLTEPYKSKKDFFVEKLSEGMGRIAAAFYPRPVLVRTSDFKTNEYRNLIGGKYFEPIEENPMLGFRGASRYTNKLYKPAFALECAAIEKVRKEMGLANVIVMVPFVRTIKEAEQVLQEMANNGLLQGKDDLQIYMMVEVPSNVILAKEFSQLFDGLSIGSNDLTQLVLGLDRDSELVAPLFDERDPAVKQFMKQAIEAARQSDCPIGICGQGPSDYPEVAQFLIDCGINSISLNHDTVLPFLMRSKR